MKGKGSRLAILLALVLTLVGAFGATAFAHDGADFGAHEFKPYTTSASDYQYIYRCDSDGATVKFNFDGYDEDTGNLHYVYDGDAKAAQLTHAVFAYKVGTQTNSESVKKSTTIEYALNGSNDEYSASAPSDAGSYNVRVSVAYNEGEKSFTIENLLVIEPADLSVRWDGDDSVVYDGEKHGKTLTAVDGLVSGHEIVSEGYQTNVGEYDMTSFDIVDSNDQSVKNNYNIINNSGTTGHFEITAKEVGIKWTDLVQRYDGTDKLPTATVNGVAEADKDDVEAVVSVPGGESKEVGTYTAEVKKLTGDAADNYTLSDVGRTTTFEVVGGTFEPGLSAEDYTYGEKGQVQRDKSTVPSDWKGGTIKWEYKEASASDDEYEPYNNKTVGPFIPVGDYIVKLTYGPTDLYDEVSGTAEFSVSPREVKVSGITADDKQYDETTAATLNYDDVEFDGIVNSDGLEVTATGTFEDENPGSGKTVNITDLTLSGEDAVNYTLAEEGQQTETTASIFPTAVVTASDGLVYGDTDEMVELSWAPSGSTQPEDYKVEYKVGDKGEFSEDIPTAEGRDADIYDVYYQVSNSDGVLDKGWVPVIINKDDIDVEIKGAVVPFNDDEQDLIEEVVKAEGEHSREDFKDEVQFSLSSDSGFSTKFPTKTNKGEYPVYWKVPGDDNHNEATGSVKGVIYDSRITPPVVAEDLTYTGGGLHLVTENAIPSDELTSDGVYVYHWIENPDGTTKAKVKDITPYTRKNAGEYKIWYGAARSKDDAYAGNFVVAPAYVTATIAKAQPEATVTGVTETYDGTEIDLAEATDVDGGTVYYSLDPNVEYTSDVPTATEAGTYIVYYFVAGDDNHEDSAVRSVASNIIKKSIDVTIADQTITYGDKFKDVENSYTVGSDGFVNKADEAEFEDALTYVSNYERFDPVTSEKNKYWISGELTETYKNNSNYNVTFSDGVLTVNPYEVTVEWPEEADRTFVYDGKAHKVRGRLKGTNDLRLIDWLNIELGYAYEPEDVVDVGDYTVTASLTGTGSENYKIKDGDESSTIKITRRPVYVTWPSDADCTFKYNGKTQGIEAAVNNVVPGEALDPVYFEKSNTGVDAAEYVAEVTELKAGDEKTKATNYELVDEYDGKAYPWTKAWRITELTVEIKWNPAKPEFTYDGNTHEVTAEITNIQTNDLLQKDDVSLITDGVWSAKDAGTYTATIDGLKGDDSLNYNLVGAKTSCTWKINPATVTVTADDQTIFYGQDYDKSKVSYKGWQGSDSASVLTAVPTVTSTYFVNAKYGTYKLNPSGAAAKNYTFKYDDGVLTVNNKVTTLVAKAAPSGSKATLSWNKVTGAKKYEVYFNKCNSNGKEYSCKKIATVKTNKFKKKGLKKGTCYKFYVVAKDANGKTIAKSKTGHFVAGGYNDSYTNAKSLKVNPSSVSLTSGQSKKLKVSQNKAKSGRILLDGGHSPLLRFRSSNTKVATVSSKGVVKAVGKGYCEVYVQATNGMWKKVAVTVK